MTSVHRDRPDEREGRLARRHLHVASAKSLIGRVFADWQNSERAAGNALEIG
jgi:hypothetical protein